MSSLSRMSLYPAPPKWSMGMCALNQNFEWFWGQMSSLPSMSLYPHTPLESQATTSRPDAINRNVCSRPDCSVIMWGSQQVADKIDHTWLKPAPDPRVSGPLAPGTWCLLEGSGTGFTIGNWNSCTYIYIKMSGEPLFYLSISLYFPFHQFVHSGPLAPFVIPLVSFVLSWDLYPWCPCFIYRHAGIKEILTFVLFGSLSARLVVTHSLHTSIYLSIGWSNLDLLCQIPWSPPARSPPPHQWDSTKSPCLGGLLLVRLYKVTKPKAFFISMALQSSHRVALIKKPKSNIIII